MGMTPEQAQHQAWADRARTMLDERPRDTQVLAEKMKLGQRLTDEGYSLAKTCVCLVASESFLRTTDITTS